MRKIIDMKHRVDDYVCMWNGIEDMYIQKTQEQLPPKFFFSLASFGSFCYMKTEHSELKRMVALGEGRTKKMYEFLAPIVEFDYKCYEGKTFEKALMKAKKEVSQGNPYILGALDMYYLHYYEKIYHRCHIPLHYVSMIGYDDDKECIYEYDCGREEIQEIGYEELKLAWDCSYPGLSRPFTIFTINMHSNQSVYKITKEALAKKADVFLHPPVGFIGYKGLEKFIKELPSWKKELSKEEYDKILFHMVQFFGTVPTIPNALQRIDKEDEMKFGGGFDKIAVVLEAVGFKNQDQQMLQASKEFNKGACVISKIKDIIVAYLTEKEDATDELPILFKKIEQVMIKGFEILEGINNGF